MAKVFLDANETFTLSGPADVFGGLGAEKVLLGGASANVNVNAAVERVELAGNLSTYTFQVTGSNGVIVRQGTTIVATILVPDTAAGQILAFADGSAALKLTGSGQATLGTTAFTSAAAVTPPATVLNTADKSTVPVGGVTPGVGQAFNLTGSPTDIVTGTSGNDTINGSLMDSLNGDTIIDVSSTDNDVLNATVSSAATVTNLTNIETLNLTGQYGTVNFTGANVTGLKTLNLASAIAGGTATVGNVGATTTSSVKAGANITSLSVTSSAAGGAVAIDTGAATSVTVTGGAGADNYAITVGAGAVNMTVDGAGGTDVTTFNLKGGTLGLTGENSAPSANETFNFVGSTAAQTINVTNKLAVTNVVSGDQNVTFSGTDAAFTTSTVTNSLAAGKALTVQVTGTAGTADFSKVAATSFDLQGTGTAVYTFANNANVKVNSTGALTLSNGSVATAKTINLDLAVAAPGIISNTVGEEFTTVNATATTVAVTSLNAQLGSTANLILTGNKAVTVNTSTTAKVLDASGLAAVLTGSAGTNVATIIGGTAADVITVNAGVSASNVAVVTNAGSDTIKLAGTAGTTVSLTLDAGAGDTDVLQLTGDANFNLNTALATSVLANFETIDTAGKALTLTQKQITTLGSVGVNDSVAVAGGTAGSLTLNDDGGSNRTLSLAGLTFGGGVPSLSINASGSASSMTLIGSSFSDTITGSSGAIVDTINAGDGNDFIFFGTTGNMVSGNAFIDSINGGNGVDTLYLTAGANLASTDSFARVTSVEKIQTTGNGVASLVLNANAEASGIRSVDITGAGAASKVDVSSFSSAAIVTITGNAAGASLIGGAGVDSITGGAGNDSITGNGGVDVLVGGGGADTITGGAGADQITSGSGIDQIKFLGTTFAALQAEGGDVITSFAGLNATNTTGINFASGLLNNGASNKLSAVTAAGTIGADDAILVASDAIAGAFDMSTAAGALSSFNAAYTTKTNFIAGDRVLYVASGTGSTTGDTYMWLVNGTGTAAVAADFTLVAVAKGVTDATAAVFGTDAMTIHTIGTFTANTDIFTIG